jgi:hypothetical protein
MLVGETFPPLEDDEEGMVKLVILGRRMIFLKLFSSSAFIRCDIRFAVPAPGTRKYLEYY